MSNRRRETVGYRRLDLSNTLSEGLLPVMREGGDLERKVAAGLFRVAGIAGEVADRKAARAGELAGQRDALAGAPGRAGVAGGGAGAGTQPLAGSAELRAIVADAARRHGVPVSAMFRTVQLESSWDPAAQNPNSSAGGLLQFIDATAGDYNLEDRFDARQAADAGARLMADNMAALAERLGRPPTDGELYLAHQQGAGGALNLLTNAGRPLTAVIGEERARLNGGADGMTAGDFANLWIAKAEAVRVEDVPGASAGAGVPSPYQSPRAVIAGQGGRFRPTRQDTVYGRAYDAAGTRTYLQALDATLRADMMAVYERDKDDPAALRRSMDALLTVHLDPRQGHVFPEIEADYRVAFARQRMSFEIEADRRAERRRAEENRAGFIERTNALNTDLARRIETFDADNPAAGTAIAGAQAAIEAHYDAAVAHGILDADSAAEAKIKARREAALGFYRKQAAPLDADAVATMRRELGADFGKGDLDGLDGAGWETLQTELIALEADKRAGNVQADNSYRQRADRFIGRVTAGFDIDPGEWSRFELDVGTAPSGESILAEARAGVELARQMRGETLAESAARLRTMRADLGRNPDDDALARLAFGENLLEAKRKALTDDPIGYAEATGLVSATAMAGEVTEPDGLAALFAARASNASLLADRFGIRPRYLKPGEAAIIADMLAAEPAAASAMAVALSDGAGNRATAILAELAGEAPTVAHALGLAIATGQPHIAAEAAQVRKLRAEKIYTAKMPDDHAFTLAASEVIGSSLAQMPRVQSALLGTARALFEKTANEQGFDPASIGTAGTAAREAWEAALDRAAGARMVGGEKHGGFAEVNGARIIVPPDMPAYLPATLLQRMTDDDLQALDPAWAPNTIGFDARDVRGGRLVAMGDGIYAVALGDPDSDDPMYMPAPDGAPWLLDLRMLRRMQDRRGATGFDPASLPVNAIQQGPAGRAR